MMRPSVRAAYALFFLLAAGLRIVDVWRPVDGTMRDSWREPDVAGMARNFYEEDMNLFLPRIDWRGDGPGYTEAEFPLYPWLVACLYHAVGYHEELLRVVSFVLLMAATGIFFRLAHERLPATGALVACMAFAANPLAARLATSIQPEPLMFLGYVSAVYFFLRWCDRGGRRDYWPAIVATAIAILGKLPAIHIGILFAALCFQHFGLSCLKRKDVWLFAGLAVGVPAVWYVWSHTLWLRYGNSLGMSNEAYLRIGSGNFLQTLSETLPGNAQTELHWIWMRGGLVLAGIALPFALARREQRWMAWWAVALAAFYVVAGRTTSEGWACHYHIVSVPLAALLAGFGTSLIPWHDLASLRKNWTERNRERLVMPAVASVCGWIIVTALFYESGRALKWDMHPHGYQQLYDCARQFQPLVQPGCLMICSGAGGTDQFGLKRAYNVPYFFFWTKTKGFSLTDEDQTLDKIEALRQRGARYYIAERRSLANAPAGFEAALRDRYRVLAEHERAVLVELPPASTADSQTAGGTNEIRKGEAEIREGEAPAEPRSMNQARLPGATRQEPRSEVAPGSIRQQTGGGPA